MTRRPVAPALVSAAICLATALATSASASSGAELGAAAAAPAKALPADPRLDSGLNAALTHEDAVGAASRLGYRVRDGRVQVTVVTSEAAAATVVGWLQEHDAAHLATAGHLVQADVDPAVLNALAALPEVVAVRRPIYVVNPGPPTAARDKTGSLASTSEGAAALDATT